MVRTMGFGAKLNNLLKSKNMTVTELSKQTGIPSSTLYAIIRRDSDNVNLSAVQKIADVFKVPVASLTKEPSLMDVLNIFSDDYFDTDENIIDIHFTTEEFTPDEIAEIIQFAEFLKQRRNSSLQKPPAAK